MGNSLGSRKKTTKVMKMNGETIKFKTPVNAGDITKDYPGLVLLDSESVKHYGVRAKALEPQEDLKPKRLYFLVELPKLPEDRSTRRVRSGITMSAKDRLENLKLARRSASDLSFMKAPSTNGGGVDPYRVKLRLPKSEVERLMRESKDENETVEKIMKLCMEKNGGGGYSGDLSSGGGYSGDLRGGGGYSGDLRGGSGYSGDLSGGLTTERRRVQWKDGGNRDHGYKGRGKRVGFLPVSQELTAEEPTWM